MENSDLESFYPLIYSQYPWDYTKISKNPSIKGNVVTELLRGDIYYDWDYDNLVENPGIQIEDIRKIITERPDITNDGYEHDDFSKEWVSHIYRNPNLTIDHIIQYELQGKYWMWWNMSSKKNITMDAIEKNPDISWNYNSVSQNPNLTIDFILKHLDENWSWSKITENPGITMEDIKNHVELPWDPNVITKNPNITQEIIGNTDYDYKIQSKIHWKNISRNPAITMDIIEKSMYRPWNWTYVSENPNLTMDFVKKSGKQFDWKKVSQNPGITMDDITNNIDLPWLWEYVSRNPNLTMDYILEHEDKPWDWVKISQTIPLFAEDALTKSAYHL